VDVPATCGANQTGTPPNCIDIPASCPTGFTGAPPICIPNDFDICDIVPASCEPEGPSDEELECEEAGGDWDGECYFHEGKVTVCHQKGGVFALHEIGSPALGAHLAHGDYLPVNGSCTIVSEPFDACPDDLNPGPQEQGTTCKVAIVDACPDETLNPGTQETGTVCKVAPTSSNTTPDNSEAPFVDPGVDVDQETAVLAVGALAQPQDAAAAEVLGAEASAGGDAAAADEDAVLAEGDDLPVTGMSPMGTVLAALLAVLMGTFSYGEAARASRRRRAARAAA
jgi:hypothetical protein